MTAGYPVVVTAHPCGHQKNVQSMEQEADFQEDHADGCGANQFTTPADVQLLSREGRGYAAGLPQACEEKSR